MNLFDSTFITPPKVELNGKLRKLVYNKHLNLFRRQRTFSGILHLNHWNIIQDYIDLDSKLNCLEIGTHEGQSAMYFLKFILKNKDSKLLCCDPFIKSHWLYANPSGLCYEDVLDFNLKNNDTYNQVEKYIGKNSELYKDPEFSKMTFDIIYVDDDHTYLSTKLNIDHCWKALKVGGIIIFDDYNKEHYIEHKPNDGGEAFCVPVYKALQEFLQSNQDYKIVFEKYQLILTKTEPPPNISTS